MKKTITNAKDATCYNCGATAQITLEHGQTVCTRCGSINLRDPRGRAFEPTFGPARTYRASRYTPELPCRRDNDRHWPQIRERRSVGSTENTERHGRNQGAPA